MRDGRHGLFGRSWIVHHVPDHALGHRGVEWTIHSDRSRAAARERAGDTTADSGNTEIVTHDWNAYLPEPANNGLNTFELLVFLWPIKQHIVPVRGIEIFDGFEF